MKKLSKKELKRQESIINKNIKHNKKCIGKCKTDPIFNKTWRVKDFKQALLFWESMKNNLKLYKKLIK